MMKFEQVVQGLVAGDYMQRDAWKETGEYVVLMPGMNTIWKILVQPQPNAGNWLPLMADILAEDWSVVKRSASISNVPSNDSANDESTNQDASDAA